jgi:hypothetical protein
MKYTAKIMEVQNHYLLLATQYHLKTQICYGFIDVFFIELSKKQN